MKNLKLHDEAEAELTQIILQYARKNEDLALRFFQEITDAFSRMVQHPEIGAPAANPITGLAAIEITLLPG